MDRFDKLPLALPLILTILVVLLRFLCLFSQNLESSFVFVLSIRYILSLFRVEIKCYLNLHEFIFPFYKKRERVIIH